MIAELQELCLEVDGDKLRTSPTHWLQLAEAAQACGYTYFSFLSAIDWLPNPSLNGEKHFQSPDKAKRSASDSDGEAQVIVDPAIRHTGGTSRFQVFSRWQNTNERTAFTAFVDVDHDMTIPSITPVFAGANWHEREAHEMFGINFAGHPDLRHIYLPDEFEGYPLRKDYPVAARLVRPWPGLVDLEDMPAAESATPPEEDFA